MSRPAAAPEASSTIGRNRPKTDVQIVSLNFSDEEMLMKTLILTACVLYLTGCYTVDDQRFAAHVQTLVRPTMPLTNAIAALEDDGFTCHSMLPTPSKTCSKARQRLLPSTCIERVNLLVSDKRTEVEQVEVQKIICAGF
jgi:hypothetical protein